MDIFTAIKGRRSFRNYLSTQVEEESLRPFRGRPVGTFGDEPAALEFPGGEEPGY